MHTINIANQIIKKAEKQGKVKGITVEVGDLAPVTVEELEKTLTAMVGWKVTVLRRLAKVKCKCGYRGTPRIIERRHELVLFVCPECNSIPEVLDGKDIILRKAEVE